MQNQIEHRCACTGEQNCPCIWDGKEWAIYLPRMLTLFTVVEGHCWNCGYHLGADGIARRTVVVADEYLQWLIDTFPKMVRNWAKATGDARFIIKRPQEGEDE